jgi:hypothetical protein
MPQPARSSSCLLTEVPRRRKHSRASQLPPHHSPDLVGPIRPGPLADPQMPSRQWIVRSTQIVNPEHRHPAGLGKDSRAGVGLLFSLASLIRPFNTQCPLPRQRKIANVFRQTRRAIRPPQISSGALDIQSWNFLIDHLAGRLVHIMANVKRKRLQHGRSSHTL